MTMYNSSYNDCYPFSDIAPQFALAANTELTYIVPGTNAQRYRIQFSWAYNANVWVAYNQTVTVPIAGTFTNAARCELRPDARFVRGGDVLHFISSTIVADAGFSLLQLPN